MFPEGTLVDGKYCLERFLGQGEMGCVFLATHVLTGESLALKVLYPVDPSQGPAAFAAFLVAARAAARFRSEHVAHVRDMGLLVDGGPFLVMEYFEGVTLEAHLHARGPLAIGDAVDLALQAARGLSEAHAAGVVHRDAKPSNWFLTETPDGSRRVKLLDFGVAKIAPRARAVEDPSPPGPGQVGWLPYAAPEQIRSPSAVDGRADIWTVGVVLHEMLAGTTPLGRGTMRLARDRALRASRPWQQQAEGAISAELDAVVLRCLERRPENRFGNMADLVLALAPLQAGVARASIEAAAVVVPLPGSSSLVPVSLTVTPLVESVAPRVQTPVPAATLAWRPVLESRLSRLSRGRFVAGVGVLAVTAGAVLFFATPAEEPTPTLAAPSSAIAAVSAIPRAAPSPAAPERVASPSATSSANPTLQGPAPVSETAPSPSVLREPRAPKPAGHPSRSSSTKASLAHPPPVGTAGFGDRE
jgi:serine/threonine-protein kinase